MFRTNSRSKDSKLYTVLILGCIIGFWVFENFYTPASYSTKEGEGLRTTIPSIYLPSSTTGVLVDHNHFLLSYNEPFEQAEWVAYILKKEHLTQDDRKRPYFIEDPKIKTKSADWRNYRGSGYDRGHLCPAGDRRFSEQAYNETFYTSNISPQDRDFNAGIWNRLEMQVRQWSKRYGEVFVATGGVLEDGLMEIGEEDVDVPKAYYKIVARSDAENLKVIAFLMSAEETNAPLEKFVVSIDEIEQRTQIDFFQHLEDNKEERLEKEVKLKDWKF
ncbi:DNA/RNA non-specific endonuclease [Ulvibacterium sp.]|uniref:DNA/RNA non-specific endonuclease n=1 Tax=Ulvibacterium sp. TaxID=2665914 RepID=UPI0026172151|nr:DNA/RNA non-specific endonuclease [Ulvibacterium sp.]